MQAIQADYINLAYIDGFTYFRKGRNQCYSLYFSPRDTADGLKQGNTKNQC